MMMMGWGVWGGTLKVARNKELEVNEFKVLFRKETMTDKKKTLRYVKM